MHEILPGDPDAEVHEVKKGWDPENKKVQRTATQVSVHPYIYKLQ